MKKEIKNIISREEAHQEKYQSKLDKKEILLELTEPDEEFDTTIACIHVSDMDGIETVKNLDEVVLPGHKKAAVYIDYPLTNAALELVESKGEGLTRREIIEGICRIYKMIYDWENESSKIKADLIPGMYNRNQTNGIFGIWGHEIGNLVIEGIDYTINPIDGHARIFPQIGS